MIFQKFHKILKSAGNYFQRFACFPGENYNSRVKFNVFNTEPQWYSFTFVPKKSFIDFDGG